MKLFGGAILKPTVTDINKDAERWSLSWQPEGRCNSFTREAILASAPPSCGVYGLFNFDCQVFIGESTNIQEALLRHLIETDFQSPHLQPTGFTFEPCAVELCKSRADELIARFHPVLQTGAALTGNGSPPLGATAGEPGPSGEIIVPLTDDMEFPSNERERPSEVRRRFHFKRPRVTALAAIFVATAGGIIYLGMPADYSIQKRASGANPRPAQTENSLRQQTVSAIDKAGGPANREAQGAPAKADLRVASSTPNTELRFAVKSTPAAEGAKTAPILHSAENALSKKWSVQVSAAPAKDIADTLAQRLKASGYDGYVVQAEVKGQSYYRVRVGRFDTKEEAESIRQSLARQEAHQDAYITRD